MPYRLIPICALFLSVSCATARAPVTETQLLLGTTCSITVFDRPPSGIFNRAFARVAEIERRMSVRIATSDIARVNAGAGRGAVPVSSETAELVARALDFSQTSRGAFDVSIGPLVELWGIGTDRARRPSQEEIDANLPLIGYEHVLVDRSRPALALARPGMRLDLGAIAKGWAADEAARILREEGVRAIIDFGGNVIVVGAKADGSPWRIGVQNPFDDRGTFVGILNLGQDTAIVTSGNYERYFELDGRRYHHIIDTTTGYPVDNGLASVTIVGRDSTDADAISTAAFVLGLEEGKALIDSLPGIYGILVTMDRQIHISAGLRGRYSHRDESFTLREW